MAHRRGSFRRGGSGISESQRRKKAWIGIKDATGAAGATNVTFTTSLPFETVATGPNPGENDFSARAAIDFGGSAAGDEASSLPEESTILRMRGSLLFPKNVPILGQVTISDNYVFGMGVTDIRSLVNGQPPLPVTDVDWDGWMFLRQAPVAPVDSVGTIVDVKSMRKIKTGDAFFMVGQAVSGDSTITPAGLWVLDLRLLLLLP